MSSNINPNNIDTAYPVAGQDNDSQGFRDNFTNIKTNFEFAADEIDDLQSKVVLKAALTGTTLDNDMGGSVIKNAKLQGTRYTRVAPSDTTGTINIDISASNFIKMGQLTGNISLNFVSGSIPSAGNYAEWTVQFTQGSTPFTVTLPAAVTIGTSTLQGYSNNVITYNRAGIYSLKFSTFDGGTNITVEDLSRNQDPIYLPSLETLTSNISLSLATTTSIINKSGSWAGNIANGFNGQTKLVICGNASPTTQVLTVASAGWKNAAVGNVTFTGQGQSATLTYIGGTWYCTGTGPDVTDAYPTIA